MKLKRIHVLGIGGIGLSALTRMMHKEGNAITGCDMNASPVTDSLSAEGIAVSIGHSEEHVADGIDLLIYSDAVPKDHPERVRARKLGIPEKSYFEALGAVANSAETLIAISGAHGKTTTTAMILDILEAAGKNPTGVVGSLRAKTKSNFSAGGSELFVVEADEFKRHFLEFRPRMLVITNIDADHLDCYKDLADIQGAFRELARRVPRDGYIICDAENERVRPVIEDAAAAIIDYAPYFDPELPLKVLSLNRINAAAALAVADILKIDRVLARSTLADFTGTWRRFEHKGTTARGALVYDDYAHHPAEVAATLASVREQFPDTHIVVAFHPHLYSRTKLLLHDFAKAFSDANEVLIAPIFAAREEKDPSISSVILAEHIAAQGVSARAYDSLDELSEALRASDSPLTGKSMLITMGAGDIYKVGESLAAS